MNNCARSCRYQSPDTRKYKHIYMLISTLQINVQRSTSESLQLFLAMLPMSTTPLNKLKTLEHPARQRMMGPLETSRSGLHSPLESKACRQWEDRQGYKHIRDTQEHQFWSISVRRNNSVGIQVFTSVTIKAII